MTPASSYKERLKRIIYFFPFQLFVAQFKKNLVLLLAWVILFGIITQTIAVKYGAPFLFLSPEYLGEVGFLSFLITGLCIGAFIMAFNIASYVTNGTRFPFLATMNRPFLRYSVNNMIIPLLFILTYVTCIFDFQSTSESLSSLEILYNIGGLLLGITVFLTFSYIYFFSTNKNLFQLFGISRSSSVKETKAKLAGQKENRSRFFKLIAPPLKGARPWKVLTYMQHPFAISLARPSQHYDREFIIRVFNQNQNNAARFQIMLFVALLILGFFKEYPSFEIPAGGSIALLFTVVLIFVTILHTWLRGWFSAVFILGLIAVNYISQFDIFDFRNKAYGLNYEISKAKYNHKTMDLHANNIDNYLKDRRHTRKILKKWKLKNMESKNHKPLMVFINSSGGGLKSAVWNFEILQYADSATGGELMDHTQLITGSSGGVIGASYFRELYLRKELNEIENIHDRKYLENISKDLLNPIAFSFTINDIFLPFKKFKDGAYEYANDRGYAFEQQLNKNTDFVMNKRLADYKVPESASLIPMLILSPTIINDGRRLLISPQRISYLTQNHATDKINTKPLIEEIEFNRFFYLQDADNLAFTSALRMNSTFPYILPLVTLPSVPTIEVMDAGGRDNYGLKTTMKFIYTFSQWLERNTSGLIIIQIRDRPKLKNIKDTRRRTLAESISAPVGSFYENLFNVQDYNNDELLKYANKWYNGNIEIIDFELKLYYDDKISLSWHLTNKEKRKIKEAILDVRNQDATRRLIELLNSR